MAKRTHTFTRNQDDSKVVIVLDKIQKVRRDEFSDCTTIHLTDGTDEGVKESVDEVKDMIDHA